MACRHAYVTALFPLMLRLRAFAFAFAVGTAALSNAPLALADAPPVQPAPAPAADLLAKLGKHAEQFEDMKRRGSFTLSGKMEELDGDGKVDHTKEMIVRSTATPAARLTEIVKYLDDGADKTDEARKKAEKRRAEGKKDKKQDFHLPFLPSQQPRYTFTVAERDPAKSQLRVVFVPLTNAEDAFKGSAWVDEAKGEVLTLAFSPSKNPTFVDRVDVTLRFDLTTPLGRAPSSIAFDARGGLLIIRKHYRGSATITDPRVAF